MKDLYLLNYNNYYNRTIKKFDTLQEYADSGKVVGIVPKVNFVENDGINTTQIINADFDMIDTPDYLVVADTDNSIHSRWFVLECAKLRSGQYQLQLKRDVIADSAEDVLNATSFIYKGTLDADDPLIYNSEGSQVNQIKQEEILFKDYTKSPWLVAYISPDVAKEHPKVTGSTEGYFDAEYNSLEEYPYYKYSTQPYAIWETTGIVTPLGAPVHNAFNDGWHFEAWPNYKGVYYFGLSQENNSFRAPNSGNLAGYGTDVSFYADRPNKASQGGGTAGADGGKTAKWLSERWKAESKTIIEAAKEYVTYIPDIYKLESQKNKIIKVGEKLYKISLVRKTNQIVCNSIPIGSPLDKAIQLGIFSAQYCPYLQFNWKGQGTKKNIDNPMKYTDNSTPYPGQLWGKDSIFIMGDTYQLEFKELPYINSTFEYNFTDVDLSNNETPYGIICLPYEDNFAINAVNPSDPNHSQWAENLSKEAYLKILQALGSINGLLYDIQILPYCPITTLDTLTSNGITRIYPAPQYGVIPVNKIDNPDAPQEEQTKTFICGILISKTPNISFNIDTSITINELKLQNETDMWRLVSPNYAGNFDFNVTKFYTGNNKVINYFHVDCSFKPYNPYIHIAPEWKGLYGKDYNDAKGLICGGDYSIDRINDQWVSYQYNNKNFQLQFDRQVESMEKQYGWGMANQAVNAVGGTITGTAGGAAAGFMAGGPVGAVVGGIAGGVSGVLQGGLNIAQSAVLGRDAIDAAKDQFNYNLENIQARPYGLTKVSALNGNNKMFPFLEHYSCTEDEKDAVRDRINFEGMTVMAIRPIGSVINNSTIYKENYVRAKIIRMNEDFKHDAHYVNEINKELAMGVYMNV